MRKIVFVLGILILVSSCNTELTFQTIDVTLSETREEPALLGDVFEVVDLISLESSHECIISSIKRIILFQNNYYVLDKKNQKCVLVFDKDGNFLRKVGKVGHGQGEYVTVEDFTIDEEGERIILLSSNSTVYAYNLSGSFLFKKILDKSLLWSITSNSDGFLLSSNHLTYTSGENANLFYHYDKEFCLKKKFGSVLSKQIYTPSLVLSNICTLRDKYVYRDMFTHKAYILDNKANFDTCYDFQFTNPMPDRIFTDTNMFMEEQLKYDYLMDNVILNDKIITIFFQGKKGCISVTDKSGKILLNRKYLGIIPKFYYSDGEYVFTAFNAYEFKQMTECNLIPQNDIIIVPESNYIIVKLKPII